MFDQGFYVVNGQGGVELLKLPANCCHHSLLFARCPDNHRQILAILRKEVSVNKGSGFFAQTEVFAVLNYAYDFYPWAGGPFSAEAFAAGRLARPEAARKGLVDHTDTFFRLAILFRKISPLQQSCPQS